MWARPRDPCPGARAGRDPMGKIVGLRDVREIETTIT